MKGKVGRPTIIDEIVLQKLESAFSYGSTDEEAAFHAGISTSTLYNYQVANPEFLERKEALKKRPILKARKTVVDGLEDPNNAKWYLERKAKSEFAAHSKIDLNAMVGTAQLTKEEKDGLLTLFGHNDTNEGGIPESD